MEPDRATNVGDNLTAVRDFLNRAATLSAERRRILIVAHLLAFEPYRAVPCQTGVLFDSIPSKQTLPL